MTDDEIIHWETGLFIEPQHFQTMQRQNIQRAVAERRLMMPFPYGVVKAEIDRDALSLAGGSRISFKTLHVVMESGLVVNKGLNATVADLDFKDPKGRGTYTICLIVRAWQGTGRVIAEDDSLSPGGSDAGTRFKRAWRTVPDENTGTDVTSVSTRVLDARLIAVGEGDARPQSDMWELMPIMQIIASDPPTINREFAPPCFRLTGSDDLKELVALIEQRAASRLKYIAANLKLPEQSQSKNDVRELLRFHALATYRAALSHALKAESLTAYDAYGICLQLLAAVKGTEISESEVVSNYKHHHPWPAFSELYEQIKLATPESVVQPRQYDLKWMDAANPFVQACDFPDVDLVSKEWICVLAVAADTREALDYVLSKTNIRVGAPLSLRFMDRERYIPWDPIPSAEVLPPIHNDGGSTSFHTLKIDPASEAWRAVAGVRQLGARYADESSAGKLRLKFRLYLKPPSPTQAR